MKGTKEYMELVLMVFLKKKMLIWGKLAIFPQKCCHKSGSTLLIFLKFSIMKGTERYIKIILMVFLKNYHFGQMGHFGPENGVTS